MSRSRLLAVLFVAPLAILSGCAAPSKTGHSFTASETRRPMHVQTAVVEAVREVRLERDEPPAIGTGAGAIVGGVAGSNVGGGKGSIIGSVLGAVAGGVLGSHAEKSLSDRPALEITVRTDSGQTLAVVQEAGGEQFVPGQRVRLLTDPARNTTRVSQ